MKKVTKTLSILLVVALVATVFIGAGAATFTAGTTSLTDGDKTYTDGSTVVPGESVKSVVNFTFNIKNLAVGDTITVQTTYNTPWEATIDVKGDEISYSDTVTNKRPSLDCINILNISSEAKVTVTCTGIIPTTSAGTSIVPLTVVVKAANSSESGTIQTATVQVYNTKTLSSDISTLSNKVAELTTRINTYNTPDVVALGISFTIPEGYVNETQTYISHAQTSGISDYTASRYVLEAQNKAAIAEKSVNDIVLQTARVKLNQVSSLITELKGLNRDVENIETKFTVYESTLNGYNSSTDPTAVDELITKIDTLYSEAYDKMYNDPLEGFMKYLPFIIIGIVAVIVALVVILLLIRRRKNSWDELG